MLTIQPMSGYDIRQTVEASIAHFWNESYGQIYPILKRLASDGWIRASKRTSNSRNRQEYAITAKGRAALDAWLSKPPRSETVRNELLLKLFFARNAPLERGLGHLEDFRRVQQAELQRFRKLERDLLSEHTGRPDLPYWLITLRFGIRHCAATIDWAEEAIRQLQQSALADRKAGGK